GLPFAAVDLGILYEDQSNFTEATGKYRMELDREDPASRQEALRGLSRSLAGEGNWSDFERLLTDAGSDALSTDAVQRYYLASGDLAGYIGTSLSERLPIPHPVGLLATVLLIVAWGSALLGWRGSLSISQKSLALAAGAGLGVAVLETALKNLLGLLLDTGYSSLIWLNGFNAYFSRAFLPLGLLTGAVWLMEKKA
ncbi:MAG: hypothetical protein KDK25_16225, partial [Leptospiraceae bacterium]|nr:hypothetical protein [Leptospiraceae bacterium]